MACGQDRGGGSALLADQVGSAAVHRLERARPLRSGFTLALAASRCRLPPRRRAREDVAEHAVGDDHVESLRVVTKYIDAASMGQ